MPTWLSVRSAETQESTRAIVIATLKKHFAVSDMATFELVTALDVSPTEAKQACVWVYGVDVLNGNGIQVPADVMTGVCRHPCV